MPGLETMAKRALILLGPPGAGKGTQGRRLTAHLGYPSISTGDALRAEIEKQSSPGRAARNLMDAGELVPDSLVNEIVQARLEKQGFDPKEGGTGEIYAADNTGAVKGKVTHRGEIVEVGIPCQS